MEELKELIKERYKSVLKFSEAIDVPYTTVVTILERGIGKATVKNAIAVCEALQISLDALSDGKIEPVSITSVTDREKNLIRNYRELNDEGKDKIDEYLYMINKEPQYKKDYQLEILENA